MPNYYGDQIFNILVEETRKANHQITIEEAEKNKEIPDPNKYAYYFKSFSNAAEQAWRKVKQEQKGASLTPFAQALIKKRKGNNP